MLFAEILEDEKGKPGKGTALASRNAKFSSPPSPQGEWLSIKFDDAVPLDKKPYWLVLKVGLGEIEWFCSIADALKRPDGFVYKRESSDYWSLYSAAGYFRLKYLPDSVDILPVSIEILNQKLDLKPTTELKHVEIAFEDKEAPGKINITLKSKALGEIEISNLTVEGKEVT